MSERVARWWSTIGQAPAPAPVASRAPDIGLPPPSDDEMRWARREALAIIRRAQALDIELELERSTR